MSETEHMHQTILDTAPIGPHDAPAVERKIEVGDRVLHSQYGEGVVIVVVPNAFDATMDTYVGIRLMTGDNVRVPERDVKWLASNVEPLPFGPEYDAPKIVTTEKLEAVALGTPPQQPKGHTDDPAGRPWTAPDAPAPHGVGVGAAKPQPLPNQPARKPVAPRKAPKATTEPQPRKKPIVRRAASGKNSSAPRSRPKHSNAKRK